MITILLHPLWLSQLTSNTISPHDTSHFATYYNAPWNGLFILLILTLVCFANVKPTEMNGFFFFFVEFCIFTPSYLGLFFSSISPPPPGLCLFCCFHSRFSQIEPSWIVFCFIKIFNLRTLEWWDAVLWWWDSSKPGSGCIFVCYLEFHIIRFTFTPNILDNFFSFSTPPPGL